MANAAVVTTDFQRHRAEFLIAAEQATQLRLKLNEEVTTISITIYLYNFICMIYC